MEFDWAADDAQFREALRDFLARTLPKDWEEISRHGPGSDAQSSFSRGFCARLAERGWLTQSWPAEYGGADATPWRHAILSEEMWRCGEPRGSQYMNVNWIGPTIMKYGSDAQKQLHLPRISGGDALWCQGFSEPEAGSDLVSLRTLALRDGDDYLVNGSKIWTSYVHGADFCFLLVRTDPEARKHKGITCLLVDMKSDGVSVKPLRMMSGDAAFNEIFFTDVRVPASEVLGEVDAGWTAAITALMNERANLGAVRRRYAQAYQRSA